MCFSAPASFISSGILATIGTTLVCRVKNKRLLALALIPLFFATQQCAEGVVWLNLGAESSLLTGAKNVFLLFAFVIWPIWIPFALWMTEPDGWRKHVMSVCFGIGLVLGVFLLLTIPNTSATSYENSIQYLLESQSLPLTMSVDLIAIAFYGIATLLPFFISGLKKLWIMGLLATLAGIVVYGIDRLFFISVWCFFAAITSLGLFYFLPKKRHKR